MLVQWLTLPSNPGGVVSIPGQRPKIPHTSQPKHQNIKQRQYCSKFNRCLQKMVHIKKIYVLKKKQLLGIKIIPILTGEQPGTQNLSCFLLPFLPSSSLFFFQKLELKSLMEHGAFFQVFTFSKGRRIIY